MEKTELRKERERKRRRKSLTARSGAEGEVGRMH